MFPAHRWQRWSAVFLGCALLVSFSTVAEAQGPGLVHHGFLHVKMTCPFPSFTSETQMEVEVLANGAVYITDTELAYGGTENAGDCVYTRTGNWSIMPVGWYRVGPPVHIEIDENIYFTETNTMECPPPVGTIEDNSDGNLNEHLAFFWDDAITGGAVVAGTGNPDNDTVWTLGLVPGLATTERTWSTLKALYRD